MRTSRERMTVCRGQGSLCTDCKTHIERRAAMQLTGGGFVFCVAGAIALGAHSSQAGIILVGTQSDPIEAGARIQNGGEPGSANGVIYVSVPSSPLVSVTRPASPFVWNYVQPYAFHGSYSAATGQLQLDVHFTPVGRPADITGTGNVTFSGFVGKGFEFIKIEA